MSIWSCLSVSGQLLNYIFTCIAELVEWVAKQNYDVTFLMYYLDDFHTLGPPGSSVCQQNLDRSIDCFSKLGISLHLHKLEGPSTCLTIPCIELDSLNLQARLPQNKVDRITFVEDWSQKRWWKRKELESLIGHLQHACKVILLFALNDQPAMRFLSWWPPDSSQSGVLSWPSLVARVSSSLGMVAASFSTPSGLHFPTSRFLQMPLGLLVTEQSSRVTGFQVHGSHHRSLSLSSTRNFSLSSWQLTSGVPSGPPNGSTSYQITAQWWTFCGLALQEPLPSCPWFAICPCWQLITSSRSLPPQLDGSLNPLLTPCLAFSFSAFAA